MRLHWDVSTLRLRPLSVCLRDGWPGLVRCVICGNVTIFLIVGLTDPYRDQLMTWPLYHPESTESSGPNTENYGGKTVIWETVYVLKLKLTNKKKRELTLSWKYLLLQSCILIKL